MNCFAVSLLMVFIFCVINKFRDIVYINITHFFYFAFEPFPKRGNAKGLNLTPGSCLVEIVILISNAKTTINKDH